MRKTTLIRYVLSFWLALPIGYALLYPQVLRCQFIAYSPDFRRLTTGTNPLYISHDTPRPQQERLLREFGRAESRIRQFWGEQRGRAVLIYCPTQAQYERYCVGGEGAGCSVGLPWGASYLILGPEGNSADVIAHELCHDELLARLGWFTVKRQVPQWFNEGLALMLDYRFVAPADSGRGADVARQRANDYRDEWQFRTHGEQFVLDLDHLESTRDFFWGDYNRVMLAYMTAGMEVSRWLADVGQAGLITLVDRVADGAPFIDTYRQIEQTHQTKARPSGRAGSRRID